MSLFILKKMGLVYADIELIVNPEYPYYAQMKAK